MWRAAVLCSLAGCFHPSPVTGIPCSEGLHCPGDQVCDTGQVPPTCVEHLADAGADDSTDAPGDAAADAAQATGCTRDTDCTAGVCHEMTGECIPDAEVVFVAAGGTDQAQCTRLLPCASLSNAFSRMTSTRRTIAVADGTYTAGITSFHLPGMVTPFLISGSHTGWDGGVLKMSLVFDGVKGTIEGLTVSSATQIGIDSRNTSETVVSRVLVSNASDDCVDNRGAKMTVVDSKLDNCDQRGVVSTAPLDLERTIITNNKQGGIAVMSTAVVVNNVIAKNGSIGAGASGGAVLAGPSITFRFNTVAGNQSFDAQAAPGVYCSTMATIEDSIIANNSQLTPQVSGSCVVKYSLFDANTPNGTGNITGAPLFVNAPSDYHLMPTSPAIDKADPAATEAVDFEGGHRPTGAARDIGADEMP